MVAFVVPCQHEWESVRLITNYGNGVVWKRECRKCGIQEDK